MVLDPLQFQTVVSIYQQNIDSLISVMGKNVTIVFGDTVTNVNSDYNDPLRHDADKIPSFKSSSIDQAPTRITNTRTIKALIKDNPKEFRDFDIRVNNANGIVRLKTFLTDVPDLQRGSYVIVHADVQNIVDGKFRLVKAPIPTGLQQDRYAITYWTHI